MGVQIHGLVGLVCQVHLVSGRVGLVVEDLGLVGEAHGLVGLDLDLVGEGLVGDEDFTVGKDHLDSGHL